MCLTSGMKGTTYRSIFRCESTKLYGSVKQYFPQKNKMKIFFLFIFPFIRIFGMVRSPIACGLPTFASAQCVTCKGLDGTLADAKKSSRPSSRNACRREHRVPAYRTNFTVYRTNFTVYRTNFYYLSNDFLLPIERIFTRCGTNFHE